MSVLFLFLLPLLAQTPPAATPASPPPAPAKPAAPVPPKKSGIEIQRESVRKQVQSASSQAGLANSPGSFFTYAWTPAPLATSPAPALDGGEPPPAPGSTTSNMSAPCDPLAAQALDPILDKASKQYGVERTLLQAVIEQESGARPCAVSPKGAQGLMQLMPATAAEFQIADPLDPEQSVQGGARFLKQLLDKYKGNLTMALSAYNAGPARVDKDGAMPDIPETQDYVRRILAKLGKVPDVQSF